MSIIDIHQPIVGAPHFTWDELTATSHRLYVYRNRRVPTEYKKAGEDLARMMERIRSFWNKPIFVHSAYRCLELNTAIGGSKTSQHMKFEACDFHVFGVSLLEVFQEIRWSDVPYGQLILEGWEPAKGDASWVHVSLGQPYRPIEKCGESLYYSIKTGTYEHV